MHKLPDNWVWINRDVGSSSRGLIHPGLVDGVPIYAQDFNGIHCVGSDGTDTYVVGERLDGQPGELVLFVVRQNYPRESEVIYSTLSAHTLSDWVVEQGGGPLPDEMFREVDGAPCAKSYAVHTYAVIRIKTIGNAPDEGETIQQFAGRVSDAVAASLNRIDVRGVAPEGCDVEQIEYAEEVSSVLVDEIVPDESDPTQERTIEHWFDDHMEPNDGNGTDPARYTRLLNLVESIAATPKEGEACADAPRGVQSWDADSMIFRLEEIIDQCRAAIAPQNPQPKETP